MPRHDISKPPAKARVRGALCRERLVAVPQTENEAFRRFLDRLWQRDVLPLLRDARKAQRQRAARVVGTAAAGAGLLLDGVLRLRGRPFTRFLTVVGSTLGALLPDVWDWSWLRDVATPAEQELVADRARSQMEQLPEADALSLFGLSPDASATDLRRAWHDAAQRWHPDKASDEPSRVEYRVRFIVYQAAYERLRRAYEEGRLPVPAVDRSAKP